MDNQEATENREEKQETALEKCEREKEEYLAGWQRSKADFLNYKREEMERVGEVLKYAGREVILNILPAMDSFELAKKNLSDELKDDEKIKGLLKIKEQISAALARQGIEEIKTLGEKFNPELHEAIEEIEVEGQEAGAIVEELQKGYTINGKLLRPSKVKIAK
ncbi:MAG: nucleotide exchange factor GrpE [Patescibacteria group bacterium]